MTTAELRHSDTTEVGEEEGGVFPLSRAAAWIIANRAVHAQASRLRLLFDDPCRVAIAKRVAETQMRAAIEGPSSMYGDAAEYVLKYMPTYEGRRRDDPFDYITLELGRRIVSAQEFIETRSLNTDPWHLSDDARLIIGTALALEETTANPNNAAEATDVLRSGLLHPVHEVK